MMKRRDFLHATLVTAGAAIAGCEGGETGNTTGETTTTSSTTTEPARVLEDGSKYFPQSVASGDPKPDSVILWKTEDLGYLTVEAAVALVKGTLKPGDKTFKAGSLGEFEIKGDHILLGKPFVFNKDNIDQFNF